MFKPESWLPLIAGILIGSAAQAAVPASISLSANPPSPRKNQATQLHVAVTGNLVVRRLVPSPVKDGTSKIRIYQDNVEIANYRIADVYKTSRRFVESAGTGGAVVFEVSDRVEFDYPITLPAGIRTSNLRATFDGDRYTTNGSSTLQINTKPATSSAAIDLLLLSE